MLSDLADTKVPEQNRRRKFAACDVTPSSNALLELPHNLYFKNNFYFHTPLPLIDHRLVSTEKPCRVHDTRSKKWSTDWPLYNVGRFYHACVCTNDKKEYVIGVSSRQHQREIDLSLRTSRWRVLSRHTSRWRVLSRRTSRWRVLSHRLIKPLRTPRARGVTESKVPVHPSCVC